MNELCGLSLGEIKEVYARICSFVTGKKLNLIPESAEKKVLVKGNGSSYKKSQFFSSTKKNKAKTNPSDSSTDENKIPGIKLNYSIQMPNFSGSKKSPLAESKDDNASKLLAKLVKKTSFGSQMEKNGTGGELMEKCLNTHNN